MTDHLPKNIDHSPKIWDDATPRFEQDFVVQGVLDRACGATRDQNPYPADTHKNRHRLWDQGWVEEEEFLNPKVTNVS